MLRKLIIIILGVPLTGIGSIFAMLAMILDGSGTVADFIIRSWARLILMLAGAKVELRGIENIEKNESYAFVSNHASLLDIPTAMTTLPYKLRFLAKKELFKIPLFGRAMLAAGHIKIDRRNLESAVKSINEASIRLKENHSSVLIFAEGTRSLTGEVGKFKKGGIILAIRMGIPIVPITISGSRKLWPKGGSIKSGKIIITIGKPISTDGYGKSNRNALVQATRDAVVNNLVAEDAL